MISHPKPHAARTGSITYVSQSKRYRARIMITGVNKYVGMFATREEAQRVLNDIKHDIENNQYVDPVTARKAQKAQKEQEARRQREQKIQERYNAWKAKQPKPEWD